MNPPTQKRTASLTYEEKEAIMENERRKWHFDRSVNLPTVLAFITLVMAALGYITRQDQRQTRAEERIETVATQYRELKVDVKDALTRVDNKLDRLIENREARR